MHAQESSTCDRHDSASRGTVPFIDKSPNIREQVSTHQLPLRNESSDHELKEVRHKESVSAPRAKSPCIDRAQCFETTNASEAEVEPCMKTNSSKELGQLTKVITEIG